MPSADPASFVQPGADFTRITPIDQKISVTLINEYISNTAQFLSDLLASTDAKLNAIQTRTENCSALISILDAKLDSIGVTSGGVNSISSEKGTTAEPEIAEVPLMTDEAPNDDLLVEGENEEPQEDVIEKPQFDPEYKRYVKMLKVGIHPLQVRMKLINEQMDPDLIVSKDGTVLINVQQVYESLPDPPQDDDSD